jgi:hypothetical protein
MSNSIEPTHPSALLDGATLAVVEALLGERAPPTKEARVALIDTNRDLLTAGDSKAMAGALARQAVALELSMSGVLAAMARAGRAADRLALARAAAVLHKACLRSLSALHQVNKDAMRAAPDR